MLYSVIKCLKIAKIKYVISQRSRPCNYLQLNRISEDKLVWYGDDRLSQAQNNVYPTYKDNIIPGQIGQAQFNWDQSRQSKSFRALPHYFAHLIAYRIIVTRLLQIRSKDTKRVLHQNHRSNLIPTMHISLLKRCSRILAPWTASLSVAVVKIKFVWLKVCVSMGMCIPWSKALFGQDRWNGLFSLFSHCHFQRCAILIKLSSQFRYLTIFLCLHAVARVQAQPWSMLYRAIRFR